MYVKFGVVDHIDCGGRSLDRLYDERLKLVETYDHLRFDAYFVAKHHATPLGMALDKPEQRSRSGRFSSMDSEEP